MKLSEAKQRGVFRTKVYIGEFFGQKEKSEWVELREPTADEAREAYYVPDGEVDADATDKVLAKCLIGASFEADDGGPVDMSEVYEMIRASASMFTKVLTRWQQSIPLTEPTEQS